MKENWKDYLLPGALASGMFAFLIGVAVFGASTYDRGTNSSFFTADDAVHPVWTTEDVTKTPVQTAVVADSKPAVPVQDGRLVKPASTRHTDMCEWNSKLLAKINTVQDYSPEKVPQWIGQFTTLTESDGAIYYYALGYVHDNFSRNKQEYRRDNFENAVTNYKRAIDLDNVAYYHHFLGQTNFFYARRTGQREYFDVAIESYKKAASLDPTWPIPPSMQGWACLEKADYEGAYALFQQALEIDSDWVCVYCSRVSEAKMGLERLRTLKPELFAEQPGEQNTVAEIAAIAAASTGDEIKAASGRIGIPETRNSYQLDKWLDKINDLWKQNKNFNPENAAKILAEKTDLKESDGAFYYFALGYLHDYMSRDSKLFRKSNYTRAVENYTNAIELDDSMAIFYHFRGQVNYWYAYDENTSEFYDKALDNYKIAEKLDPTWPMPVDMQGWTAFRKGNCEEAIAQLERALEIDADCLDALKCMAEVYMKLSNDNPNDAEVIKKGLATIKRLHTLLKDGKKFGSITYVTGWSNQLIQRLKTLETVNEETYPELLSRQERLDFICEMIRNKEYAKALEKIDALDAGEESIYHYSPNTVSSFSNGRGTEKLAACRAVCYYETGDYENAFEHIKTIPDLSHYEMQVILRNSPSLPEYYVRLLVKLERYDELVEWSSQGRNTSPSLRNFVDVYVNDALFKTGQTEKACDMYASRWLSFNKNTFSTAQNTDIEEIMETFDRLSAAYFEACYQKALKESAGAMQQPGSGTSRLVNWMNGRLQRELLPTEYYKKIAELLAGQKNYRQAITYYEKYVHFVPNDETTLYALLGCYQLADQHDANALRVATQLIAMAPNNPDYWMERAYIQHKTSRGDWQQLRYDINRAIELLEANNAEMDTLRNAYMQRAEFALQTDPVVALEDCLKVIEMFPPMTRLEDLRCQTFLQPDGIVVVDFTTKIMQSVPRPGIQRVVPASSQLLEKGGDERLLLGVRANAYMVLGEFDKAIDDYKVIVIFEPSKNDMLTKSDAYVKLGDCYRMTNQLDDAIESYTLALEENPDNRVAYQGRATAYQLKSNQPGLTEEQRNELRELSQQDRQR